MKKKPPQKVRTFDPESHWDECSAYPVVDWQHEVAEDNTRLGYCDWVNHQIEDEVQPLLAKEDCVTLNPDELSSELKAEILRNGWINSTETVTVIFNSDLSAGSPSEDQQKKAESD